MKSDRFFLQSNRLGLSFILLMSIQGNPVWAKSPDQVNPGLLPIEKSLGGKSLIEELFNTDGTVSEGTADKEKTETIKDRGWTSGNTNPSNRNSNGNSNSGIGSNNGNSNGNRQNARNSNPNSNSSSSQNMKRANVADDFRCNLFENVPYEDMLSAVNALNQAVNSPNCGESKMSVQGIVDNNAKIKESLEGLRNYIENPDLVKAENASEIVNRVDVAIRAATGIANSFAQTDLLTKECRASMNAGEVAVAINDVINGLTPYALMAAQFTGGTAAVPFIVGGSIVTNAISSMAKIIDENSVNVNDAQVRRAIVENTCQYIRLDQKYKFLIKSRQEQMTKITQDISASQNLFSAKMEGLSGNTNSLIVRKNALDKISLEVNSKITNARSQLELDKQFMNGTSDDIKICQLGIQLAVMSKDKSSYVSNMLISLDEAMGAYGVSTIAQAQALKVSSDVAVKKLEQYAANQFLPETNYGSCATATKSFVETIEQAATLSKQLVKMAQADVEKNLQGNREYGQFRARLSTLNQKQNQAERVAGSLDNLKKYATSITQSEIASEMDRLRRGLFSSKFIGTSPVLKWFEYVKGLHEADVSRFKNGLQSLRNRAYKMTKTGATPTGSPFYTPAAQKQFAQDTTDARNLVPFNLSQVPLGTREHDGVCREMQDVWNRWVISIDHLAAMESLCSMIEPYIYDNRSEDAALISMCRGFSKESSRAVISKDAPSTLAMMKTNLIKDHTRDWALFIEKKMEEMVCLETASLQ